MTFTDEQKKLLDAPLEQQHVQKPNGRFGPKGDYLFAWHVINEANRIFGYGGWSSTIDLNRDFLEKVKDKNNKDQWQAGYSCICTVTVGDVVRQDVGFGSGYAAQMGDAIEGATKEAASDALKRALRTFGNQFGLALYDKTQSNVIDLAHQKISDAQLAELSALLQVAGVTTQQIRTAYKVQSLDNLTVEQWQNAINRTNITIKQKEAS